MSEVLNRPAPGATSGELTRTPSKADGFVARPRLTTALLNSRPARLVLLEAPAGYSKTTCLADWAAAEERAVAWVTLDHRHSDPALLIASIVGALAGVVPLDPVIGNVLERHDPWVAEFVLEQLEASLRHQVTPFVLILDDVEQLAAPEAFAVIEGLVGVLPQDAQLALASRIRPDIHLGRLRARQELFELTAVELRMTRAESAALLGRLGMNLNPTQIDALFDRTEGWPAALYLAGLAITAQTDIDEAVFAFAGDDRIVADYLRDEFLSSTLPDDLEFLMGSSVLAELDGAICDFALQRTGSNGKLRELVRSNALIVPLDRNETRFRYHRLLTGMLRTELHRRDPEGERLIHARASHWYVERSNLESAIEHAILAADSEFAGDLIWRAVPEMTGRGQVATLERWLRHFGKEEAARFPTLSLSCAHVHTMLGEGELAAHFARQAEAAAGQVGDTNPTLRADIHLIRATLAADGVNRMADDAAAACDLLGDESPWQSPAHLYQGVAEHLLGQPEQAVPLLREAARRGAVSSSIIQSIALAQLGLIAIDRGDWPGGSLPIRQAYDQVQRCGLSAYPSNSLIHSCAALVQAQRGNTEQARRDLATAERLLAMTTAFPPWYTAENRLVLFRACMRLGDLAGASRQLETAARALELTPDAIVLNGWAADAAAALQAASAEGDFEQWRLTRAELRILRYLPSHLSFRQIGERLHLSTNTVKTQVQATYRKLGATSRADAVERAQAAGLLKENPLG